MTLGTTLTTFLATTLFLHLEASGAHPAPAAAAARAEPTAAQEGSTLVRYDLRSVLPQFDTGSGWTQALVSELAHAHQEFPDVDLRELYEQAPSEVVLDIVTQVLGDELHYEGRELSLEGDDGLIVLAPPALQEQVAAVLAELENALTSSEEVRLDLYTLDSGGGEPSLSGLTGGVVTTQQADRLADRLAGQGAHHVRHTFALSPGRTAVVDQPTRISFVGDYDVEIAHGVFACDPVNITLRSGLRVLARGVPMSGGTALSMIITHHALLDGVRERPLSMNGAVSRANEGGLEFVPGPETYQTVDLLTRSFACTTLLPDAGAVVMTAESNQHNRRSLQVVVLRRTSAGRGPLYSASIPGTERTLMVVNGEALRRPMFELESGALYWGHPFLFAALDGEPSSFLFDWLKYRFSVWRRLGPWAIVVTDPAWDDRAGEELERLVRLIDAGQQTIDVSGELSSTAIGSPLARWSLPVLPGSECGVVLGVTSTMLRDYNVEVAQHATVRDPVVTSIFDGLVLELDLGLKDGQLSVAAKGTAQHTAQPMGSFATKGPFEGRVDQADEEVFQFDERRRVSLGQELVLGAESSEPSALPGLRVRLSFGG